MDTDNSYTVIDLTGLSDDLQLAAVYAATGFATDIIVQNGDVGTALLSDELWKLLGANSNPLAADYTMQMVKLIRSQGGIAGVTSQGMADMMALDGGKYGKGILDSCRVKIILQMEEQEARLVQEKLDLTEEETRMITRFRRGGGPFVHRPQPCAHCHSCLPKGIRGHHHLSHRPAGQAERTVKTGGESPARQLVEKRPAREKS